MKAFHNYLLIVALSSLPLVSIFTTQDLPHTHDGLVHLPRIGAYFKALMDGQLPVRWAADLNYGYGMPLFNFIYHLPYFISSLLIMIGFGLVNAFKLTLAASYILSGIFMFAFAREFFDDEKKALLAAIFYQFAPFRLVELLIRGSFGEVYTYTFFPLVLLGLTLLIKKPRYGIFLLTAIASTLLVLSHNSVSLLFFIVCILFILFFAEKRKHIVLGFSALVLGLMLPSFYWIPALLEHKYTYGDLFMRNLYLEHFVPLQYFFIPNFTNLPSLQTGGISVQIGLFHVLAIVLALINLRSKALAASERKLLAFCLFLVVSSLFFTQPISKIFWENVSFLRQFQFPWRFLSIIVFTTSLLSVSFLTLSFFKKKFGYILLLALVVVSTANFWRPQLGIDKIDEGYYWNFPLNTTYYGETDVIWSAGPASSYPKERVEIIAGKGTISNFSKKSNLQTFTVKAATDVSVVSRTQYFPGWRVYIDGQTSSIQFQDPNWRGVITFPVLQGVHNVRIAFEETKLRLLADAVSLFSMLFLSLLSLSKVRKVYGT